MAKRSPISATAELLLHYVALLKMFSGMCYGTLLACLTGDYKSAREKCVLAQLTSDLDTEETDAERIKSRARRQKSHFRLIDDVEPDDDSKILVPTPSPHCSARHTASLSTTLCPPPPPPASLTPKIIQSPSSLTPKFVPPSGSLTPKSVPPPASLSPYKRQRVVPSSTPRTSPEQDVTEHFRLQHGNGSHFLYVKI